MIDRTFSKQENSSYIEEKYKYNIIDAKYTIEPNVVTAEDVVVPYDDFVGYNIIK